jgi:cold shock CspA family protein
VKQQKKPSGTWALGHINWYDPNSGKGSIIGDDGVWYRIHEYSNLEVASTDQLKDQLRVRFELAPDSVHPIVRNVKDASKSAPETKKKKPATSRSKVRNV